MSSSLRDRAKHFERGPLCGLLALAVSVRQTVKHRSPQWLHVDRNGDWINRQGDVCIASPTLYAVPFRVVFDEMHDYWCHGFALRPGDTVVDVGAGIGDDVVAFSREVGLRGRVIAIEASPRTYRCLVKTVSKSRLANVTTLQVAISDREGELVISDELDHFANRVTAVGRGERVRARPLDAVLAELGVRAPTLVKLNIEGAETDALRGMPETLRTARRVVVSCHDFVADDGGDPAMRTYEDVEAILRATGRRLSGRPDDPRPWVRCYVYADATEGG